MGSAIPVDILIENFYQDVLVGSCRWNYSDGPRPTFLTVLCKTQYVSGQNDGMALNYVLVQQVIKSVTQSLQDFVTSQTYMSMISQEINRKFGPHSIDITLHQPKANLYSKRVGHKASFSADGSTLNSSSFVENLGASCILGLTDEERSKKQRFMVSFEITPACSDEQLKHICDSSYQFVSESKYRMTKDAAEGLINSIMQFIPTKSSVTLRWNKSLNTANSAEIGVELTCLKPCNDRVFLSLDSNLGFCRVNIQDALQLLCETGDVKLVKTSRMYHSDPIYVLEQPKYSYVVCEVRTTLSARNLLAKIQRIEKQIGRQPSNRHTARVVNINILIFGELCVSDENLTIPHKLMHEWEFVLRPLLELCPDYFLATKGKSISQLLQSAPSCNAIPATQVNEGIFWEWGKKTYIMGILNSTPDSFSDGGQHNSVSAAVNHANLMIDLGANCIDIGGCSTRPGAVPVDQDEEIQRVVPIIEELRLQGFTEAISIDTSSAAVAKKAIQAGANIINDVTGGCGDPDMLTVMSELQVPVILMHSRGTPLTMQNMTQYENGGVLEVCAELEMMVSKALEAGVFLWNIILDPGIGFAKDSNLNLDLLNTFSMAVAENSVLKGLPHMIGASRKSFIGKITKQKDPAALDPASAAIGAYSIMKGANILRVHDVCGCAQTVRVMNLLRKMDLRSLRVTTGNNEG